MNLLEHPSPNHRPRRSGVRVDTVLLHHTGTDDKGHWSDTSALNTLGNAGTGVSAHYLVGVLGQVWRLVPEELKAFHAGWGRMPWEPPRAYDFGDRSVGIEIVNPGDGRTPFTEAQYQALAVLVPDIVGRLGAPSASCEPKGYPALVEAYARKSYPFNQTLPMTWVMGHRQVACDEHTAAFGRKTDPADNFDWARVRAALDSRVA